MRLLLYISTGFFIVLAGVFSYFAFQGTEHSGGAKVVLSIDSREAPGGGVTAAAEDPDRDVYAEAASRLKRLEAAKDQGDPTGENHAEAPRADVGGAEVNADQNAETSGQQDVAAGDRDPVADAPQAGGPDANTASDSLSALPGTALRGADENNPSFRTTDQSDEPTDSPRVTAEATQLDFRSAKRAGAGFCE
jgi:hypothetical protein